MRSIKTKLFSLAMAVSMVLALAGCAMSAPSTVGSIGGVEIGAVRQGECVFKKQRCSGNRLASARKRNPRLTD